MKTNAKKIIALIMFAVMILSNTTAVIAAEVEPIEDEPVIEEYENCDRYYCLFDIDNNGEAVVYINYLGNSSTFTYAKATVKLQKKFLLFFWSDVPVNSNSQWVDYCYDLYGDFYFSHQLDSTGTYRAVIELEFHGNTNVVDSINESYEDVYS